MLRDINFTMKKKIIPDGLGPKLLFQLSLVSLSSGPDYGFLSWLGMKLY